MFPCSLSSTVTYFHCSSYSGVCSLLSLGILGKFLSDIQMIIGGITVCALGIFSFAFLKSVEMGADNSVVHYAIGIFLIYGVGYPVGHTAVIGLFSKGKSLIVKVLFSLDMFTTHATYTYLIVQLLGEDRRGLYRAGLLPLVRWLESSSQSWQGIFLSMMTSQLCSSFSVLF